jgi:hypothetical protein
MRKLILLLGIFVSFKVSGRVLLAPRQAEFVHAASAITTTTNVVTCSMLVGTTNYVSYRTLSLSNAANIVTIVVTNPPAPPKVGLRICFPATIPLLFRTNLTSPAVTNYYAATVTVLETNLLAQGYFQVPIIGSRMQVELPWEASPSPYVKSYNAYWGTASRTYTSMTTVAADQLSMVIPLLSAGVTFYFAVSAVDVAGMESEFSNEVTFTVPTPGVVPTIKLY